MRSRLAGYLSATRQTLRRRWWQGRLERTVASHRLIVLDVQAVGLREHADPLVRWFVEHENCAVIVAVRDDEFDQYCVLPVPGPSSDRVLAAPHSVFAELECAPAATVSFHPQLGSRVARRFAGTSTKRIVMQHGMSDKVVFSDRDRPDPLSDFDAVLLIGSAFRDGSLQTYRQRYPDTYSRLQFIEVGSPKTDCLFDGTFSRLEVLSELGLPPSKPTVLYAPTWERWASLERHGLEIIEGLARLDINVIVKLHHASLSRSDAAWILQDGHGGKDWRRLVMSMEERMPNLRLAVAQDAGRYLVASDLLVSDASGIAYEFLLQDRPVVFFDVPDLFDIYGREGIHYWGRTCGEVVPDTATLCESVIANLADPAARQQQRQQLISRISAVRGNATATACETIIRLVNESHPGLS